MKERLIIKNFGPIKSVDLDLGKITILIGEQASGKSTVAKVLAITRFFSYIVDDSSTITNHRSNFSNTALRDWGLEGFETDESYILYENQDYLVEIKNIQEQGYGTDENGNQDRVEVYNLFKPHLSPKSEKFKKLLKEYEELKPNKKVGYGIIPEWHIPHTFLTTSVKRVVDNPFYFPMERGLQSIFSLGKSSIQNLSDSLYNQFARLDQIAKSFQSETEIEPLDVMYQNRSGEGYIKLKKNTEYHKLSQGASGYKSAIPIVLAIKYYNEIENRKRTFIIEEPEQNLFPKSQKKLVEFIVESVNKYDNSFFLPTHSPYILSALNNLLAAFRIGQDNPKAVSKIYDKKVWISTEKVSAYSLEYDSKVSGTIAKNLILEDLSEISMDYLDGISSEINHDWDEIMQISFSDED